jgi:hypothetical protein
MASYEVQTLQESIKEQFQKSEDVVFKELHTNEKYIEVFYIKTICDEGQMQTFLIKPFFEIISARGFLNYLQSHPKISPFESQQKTVNEVIQGAAVLFYQEGIFLLDTKVDKNISVIDTTVETTILGPQSGFSESLPTNIGLIRNRYPALSLMVDSMKMGTISNTSVNLLYDSKKVDKDTLVKVKQFLSSIQIEMFQSGEQLQDFTKKSQRSLFPTLMVTERPDRTAINLDIRHRGH